MTTYRFPEEAGDAIQGDAITGEAIIARLARLGLPGEGLRVARDGRRVVLEGPVPDEATQERIVLAVGNIQGVGVVEDNMQAGRRSGLLEAFGGLAHLPAGAANLNAGEAEVSRSEPEPGTTFGPGGSLFHTVQPGETLEGIAQRHFGTTREAEVLREANAPLLADDAAVRPGMVLRLPTGRPRRAPGR